MNIAPVRCAARSATASSTGCTSVGDAEMTRRISLIAVCCSSASFVWLNSRTLSIAIAACCANVSSSETSSVEKWPGTGRQTNSAPYAVCSRISGTAITARKPNRSTFSRTSANSVSISGTMSMNLSRA